MTIFVTREKKNVGGSPMNLSGEALMSARWSLRYSIRWGSASPVALIVMRCSSDQVGQAFCSIDDDVICQLASAPDSGRPTADIFAVLDPFLRWTFADRESAATHSPEIDADFLGSHEERSSVIRWVRFQPGWGTKRSTRARRPMTLCGAARRQRAVCVPPALVDPFWRPGEFRPPCISSTSKARIGRDSRKAREAYRASMASRDVFVVSPAPAVGDASTSPGMAMGLDHRELLPPFFPVLHAEDFIYGAALWQTVGTSFLAHSPIAIRHEPRPGKAMLQPGELNANRRAVIFEFAHLIRRIILRFSGFEAAGTDERMRALGRYLCLIGEQPERDFVENIRAQILEHESGKIDQLETQLREDTETPDFWRDDLEAYVSHIREALTYEDFRYFHSTSNPTAATTRIEA